jgi:hypothetical protein
MYVADLQLHDFGSFNELIKQIGIPLHKYLQVSIGGPGGLIVYIFEQRRFTTYVRVHCQTHGEAKVLRDLLEELFTTAKRLVGKSP